MPKQYITVFAIAALLRGISYSQTASRPPSEDLAESLESLLQTKVVTASRFSEDAADAPGVISVLKRSDLDRFGGLSLREILNRVSGLNLVSNTFSDRSIISVRGEQAKDTSSHVLFLINGRATREVVQGGVMTDLLEAFPVGVIDRIEVIEGPGSVLYGSNAYSGVINIITKKTERTSGAVRGFGTANGASGGSAEGTYRKGALSISGGAQGRQESRWGTALFPDFGAGIVAPQQPFTLYSKSRGVFAEAGYHGFSAMFASMDQRSPFETFGSSGENHWRRTFADLGYDLKAAAHWDMGVHATYTRTGLQSDAFPLTDRTGGALELNWTNSIAVNERTQVTFGALYAYEYGRERDVLFGPQFTAINASRPALGFYGQLQYRLFDNLQVIGGLQTNKVDDIPIRSVPRVGLLWQPLTHWHVKALYGQAYRAPSLAESFTTGTPIDGNRGLAAELASTLDFGVTYQNRAMMHSAHYFRSRQTRTIVPVLNGGNQGGLQTFQYQNIDGLLFHGLQWESKWYLTRRWLAEGSALYQTNEDPNGVRQLMPTPQVSAKAGLSFADPQGWTVGVFDAYSGAIPGFASRINPKPGPHHLLTANLRLSLARYFGAGAKNLAVFAHGDNLVNRTVWAPAWGFSSLGTLPMQRGRTLYYGIEFSFRRD